MSEYEAIYHPVCMWGMDGKHHIIHTCIIIYMNAYIYIYSITSNSIYAY